MSPCGKEGSLPTLQANETQVGDAYPNKYITAREEQTLKYSGNMSRCIACTYPLLEICAG